MSGWISRINPRLLLHSLRSLQLLETMWTIRVMMIHTVICLWMTRICRHLLVNNPSRILMMILSSCTLVVILRRILPEAALRCRYRKVITTTQTWICRWIRMVMVAINRQEAVHKDRDLAMLRHRTSRPSLWSIMMSHLLLEFLLVLLVRFLSLLVRTKCLVHRCRGRRLLHRLFLFLFHRIHTFRFHKARDRLRLAMCPTCSWHSSGR